MATRGRSSMPIQREKRTGSGAWICWEGSKGEYGEEKNRKYGSFSWTRWNKHQLRVFGYAKGEKKKGTLESKKGGGTFDRQSSRRWQNSVKKGKTGDKKWEDKEARTISLRGVLKNKRISVRDTNNPERNANNRGNPKKGLRRKGTNKQNTGVVAKWGKVKKDVTSEIKRCPTSKEM